MRKRRLNSVIGFWISDQDREIIEKAADRDQKAISETVRELLAAGMVAKGLVA